MDFVILCRKFALSSSTFGPVYNKKNLLKNHAGM